MGKDSIVREEKSLKFAERMKIIAHRGSSYERPENTMTAVALAWEEHSDGVEIDVHLSRDGRIVVIHDASTYRTTGQDFMIKEQDWAHLRRLDAGAWKGDSFRGERFPLLDEVLDTVPKGKKVYIDIKCNRTLLPVLQKVLLGARVVSEQVVFVGAELSTLGEAKSLLPNCTCLWNVHLRKQFLDKDLKGVARLLIERVRSVGLNGLGLGGCERADRTMIQAIQDAELELFTWTIDTEVEAHRLLGWGVDALATNRPGWMRQRLFR